MKPMRSGAGTRKKRGARKQGVGPKARKKPARSNGQKKVDDPDGLALSKSDILEFCDRVLKKWQQDPVQNARNIPAMLAVRTSVFFSEDTALAAIWSEIISWVFQLLYENAQAQARKEGLEWADVFSRIGKE